jgi:hydroxymethylpyrimidine/phosphomethylpyrimidine kinase
MIDAMRELLLPQVTILTPNSLEARHLALQENDSSKTKLYLNLCAQRLLDMGCEYVLITGTHENTVQVTNTLFSAEGIVRSDHWQRLEHTYHGSGCTLASAIAACLANGLPVSDSVIEAQDYTWQTLQAGFRPGMGQHIPNRLYWAKLDEDDTDTEEIRNLEHPEN